MNYGFIIDNRRCIGCHACTVACKAEHETPIGVNRTWVKYIERGRFPSTRRHFSVMRCNHCSDAPCVEICPVTALFHRQDGIVDFDNRRCIGCKACTQACPYDAIYIDPESHTAAKCNYCAHRVEVALELACVNVCPETAIISGDLDDPDSKISRLLAREQVTVRKPEKASPKLFYINGDQVSLNPELAQPERDYFWSSQKRGVGHYARYATERLESMNGDAESDLEWVEEGGERVLVPEGKNNRAELKSKAREVLKEHTRRVYDAPAKGVLWGWEVSAYMWTKAVSVGIFLTGYVPGALEPLLSLSLALFFLALTGILLVKDLDRPERFLYVVLRPQWNSWLVRGAYIISGYGLSLVLLLLAEWWELYPPVIWALRLPAALLALLTAVYTAFLFAQARGRDLWQSPFLSLHMLIHAILCGAAVVVVMEGIERGVLNFQPGSTLMFWLLISLASLAIEISTVHPTADSKRAIEMMTQGRFQLVFWGGVVLLGHLVPMVFLFFSQTALVAGLLVLIGVYLIQDIWVRAPQLIPLS